MRLGFSESPDESFKSAVEFAAKAESAEPNLASTQTLLGGIHLAQRQYDEALEKGRRAIELSPNAADAYAIFALTTYFVGDWPQTIQLIEEAMRLSPYYPSWWLLYLGRAQTYNGEYDAAIATHKKGLALAEGPDMKSGFHNGLAFAYMEVGDERLAREQTSESLKLDPNYSLTQTKKDHRFHKNPADLERRLNALRKAGMPE